VDPVPPHVWIALSKACDDEESLLRYLAECRRMKAMAKKELADVRLLKKDLMNKALRRGVYASSPVA